MLIKWIVCQVNEETKEAFSKAQEGWVDLRHVEGFIGQFGGWNVKNPLEACILGFWQDQEAFQNFMKYHHDPIYEKIEQKATYHGISENRFEQLLEIPGSAESLPNALAAGTFLRVADNYLYEGRVEHFINRQQEVWNPGMAAHAGMLAGTFSRNQNDPNRFLVVSVWQDEAAHHEYATTMVASLRQRADVEADLRHIVGTTIRMEPRWSVTV